MSRAKITCARCGASFPKRRNRNSKYCSVECRRGQAPPPPDATCDGCGVRFVTPRNLRRADRAGRRFCSIECKRTIEKRTQAALLAGEKTCANCGEGFRPTAGVTSMAWARRRYCSPQCVLIVERQRRKDSATAARPRCQSCGALCHGADRAFCSHRCRWSEAHVDVHGVKLSIRELAEIVGVKVGTMRARVEFGRDPFAPLRRRGK
jgi:hypothetical protein